MERAEAVSRLKKLIGKDIRKLAEDYKVTVWSGEKINKGWFGHTIERFLGLPLNSSRSPNFGSWELKCIPVKRLKSGKIVIKETMAVTMIDPVEVVQKSFEQSHLFAKLNKAVICIRMFEDKSEPSSEFLGVETFDLVEPAIYKQIQKDYELVQNTIANQGFEYLTGKMGVYVQPRTKGAGHGSTSRAFYARKGLLQVLISKTLKQLNS